MEMAVFISFSSQTAIPVAIWKVLTNTPYGYILLATLVAIGSNFLRRQRDVKGYMMNGIYTRNENQPYVRHFAEVIRKLSGGQGGKFAVSG
jgi:choline-glycine betaine transporter